MQYAKDTPRSAVCTQCVVYMGIFVTPGPCVSIFSDLNHVCFMPVLFPSPIKTTSVDLLPNLWFMET